MSDYEDDVPDSAKKFENPETEIARLESEIFEVVGPTIGAKLINEHRLTTEEQVEVFGEGSIDHDKITPLREKIERVKQLRKG